MLTRYGIEGDCVVVDMEYAGPDCTEWSLDILDKWDAGTLNQVSVHDAMLQSGSSPSCKTCCYIVHQSLQNFTQIAMEMHSCLHKHTVSLCFVQTGQYDKMSDMHQIILMIDSFPVSKPDMLKTLVELLMAKQLSALDALQHPWRVQA